MKKVKKNLFGLSLALSMMLGMVFAFVPQEVKANVKIAGCSATLECRGGGTASCYGEKKCTVYSNYVQCDEIISECANGGAG